MRHYANRDRNNARRKRDYEGRRRMENARTRAYYAEHRQEILAWHTGWYMRLHPDRLLTCSCGRPFLPRRRRTVEPINRFCSSACRVKTQEAVCAALVALHARLLGPSYRGSDEVRPETLFGNRRGDFAGLVADDEPEVVAHVRGGMTIDAHAVARYIERVDREAGLALAEHEMRIAAKRPLFECRARNGTGRLWGLVNSAGRPFLVLLSWGNDRIDTAGEADFWKEARPHWRALGMGEQTHVSAA